MKRMPALFIGHGSPMLALDHNEMTKTLTELGKRIITDYGRPKAIAVVSAHWYSRGSYVNAEELFDTVWAGASATDLTDAIKTTVYSLRRKLGEGNGITSTRGKGYRLS